MPQLQKSTTIFYFKTFMVEWGLCCLVYAFMFFQFWWGNHDWEYVRHGVELNSGFFEARYSQHIPTILLFEGQFFPIMTILVSLLGVILFAIFSAAYLQMPKKTSAYVLFSLFIGLNPHIFALFYYQHILISFIYWPLICLWALYWIEQKQTICRFLVLVLALVGGLGSYPPLFTLIFCLFVIRRLWRIIENNENLRVTMWICLSFVLALVVALCIQKSIHFWLVKVGYVSPDMYNLQMRNIWDIFQVLPYELKMSIMQFFHQYAFMGSLYVVFSAVLVGFGIIVFIFKECKSVLCLIGLLGLFLLSRFTFIVADNAYNAEFRIEYWGKLGIYIFVLSVLFRQKALFIKNISLCLVALGIICFAKTDFEIQKVQALAFRAEGNYQQRIYERILQHQNFDKNKSYISFVFGLPNLRRHFYYKNDLRAEELLDYSMIFGFDFVNKLFESEGESPIGVGMEVWEGKFFRAIRNPAVGQSLYSSQDDEYILNIMYWLYNKAEQYPNANAIYIDNRYIILVPDAKTFYQKREQFIQGIKDKGH